MAYREQQNAGAQLLNASAYLTVATLVAGALGYVFQVLMGRLLEDAEFATFSSLNALTMVVGSPLAALMMLIARRVAALQANGEGDFLSGLYGYWQTRIAVTFLSLSAILLGVMPSIQSFMRTADPLAVWLFFGVVALNALVIINAAFLQGLHRFRWLGGLSVGVVLLKIMVASALIAAAGWGLRGALAGMLTAAFITWAFGRLYLIRAFPNASRIAPPQGFGFAFADSLSVVTATVGFAILSQIDVPLANWLFEPVEAGSYAAAAALGKAVLYVPGGIVLALFPIAAASLRNPRATGLHLLHQSLFVTTVLCGGLAIAYSLSGPSLIAAVYGNRYPLAGAILREYGWAMLPVAIALTLKNFFIAVSVNTFSWLIGSSTLLVILFILVVQPTPSALLRAIGLTGSVLCLASYGLFTIQRVTIGTAQDGLSTPMRDESVIWKRFPALMRRRPDWTAGSPEIRPNHLLAFPKATGIHLAFFYITYPIRKVLINLFEIYSPRRSAAVLHGAYLLSKFVPAITWTRFASFQVMDTCFGTFHLRRHTFDAICASPDYERPDVNLTCALLAQCQGAGKSVIYLDIGANIGAYAIKVANRFRGWQELKVVAFEPHPESYQLLCQNIATNSLADMVEAYELALYESSGSQSLSLNPTDPGSSTLRCAQSDEVLRVSVRLESLDWFLVNEHSWLSADVVFLKLDVEGAEVSVLEGATAFLAASPQLILMVEDFINPEICNYLRSQRWRRLIKCTPYNSFWIREASKNSIGS